MDSRVHAEVLRGIVDRGYAPSLPEIAAALGVSRDETEAYWRKWTRREAQTVFASVGLTGAFWRLSDDPGAF